MFITNKHCKMILPVRLILNSAKTILSKEITAPTSITITTASPLHPQSPPVNHNTIRYKHKGTAKNVNEESSESEDDNVDDIHDKSAKVFNVNVGSLRLDGILKLGLGIARHKIEVMFYESRIRLNGEKVLKKSCSVNSGDEIDVIKGFAPQNPNLLTVSRVEILNASAKDDGINLKLRRWKSLMIENYEDPWKKNVVSK